MINLDLTKDQFELLVIALEERNLHLGLSEQHLLPYDVSEISDEMSQKIEDFEDLQDCVYKQATNYDLQDQFCLDRSTNKMMVKPDSDLEQKVWESIEITEGAVWQEEIVKHFMGKEWKEIHNGSNDYDSVAWKIEEKARELLGELKENGFKNLYFK